MSTKLFVGGLPWAMDNQRLKEVFAEFGDLEDARVILDRETGRSRGFGFVTYADPAGADRALELDGQEVDGRRIRVDRAQEKERGGGGGRRPGGGPGGPGGGPGGPPRSFEPRDDGGGGGRGPGGPRPERREFKDDWGGDRDRGRKSGKGAKGSKGAKGARRRGRGRGGGGEDGGGPDFGYDDDY